MEIWCLLTWTLCPHTEPQRIFPGQIELQDLEVGHKWHKLVRKSVMVWKRWRYDAFLPGSYVRTRNLSTISFGLPVASSRMRRCWCCNTPLPSISAFELATIRPLIRPGLVRILCCVVVAPLCGLVAELWDRWWICGAMEGSSCKRRVRNWAEMMEGERLLTWH